MSKLDPAPLGFRPMQADDIPLTYRWLNTDFVKEWYPSDDYSYAAIARVELESINGEIPNLAYIITYAGQPIGYIQCYLLDDWPDYAQHLALDEKVADVDLYIGEADYLHRGLGGPILRRFLREVVFPTYPDVPSCIIAPDVNNEVAKRAYAKAGFTYLKTVNPPNDPGPECVMRISREQGMMPGDDD